jgi:hypothetical protein
VVVPLTVRFPEISVFPPIRTFPLRSEFPSTVSFPVVVGFSNSSSKILTTTSPNVTVFSVSLALEIVISWSSTAKPLTQVSVLSSTIVTSGALSKS